MKEDSTVPRCIMAAAAAAAAAERPKLLYVIVQDELPGERENVDREPGQRTRRYTRVALQSTIQFMGCKPRHAFKISTRVFDVLRNEPPFKVVGPPGDSETNIAVRGDANESATKLDLAPSSRKPPKPSQKRSMVLVSRGKFLDVVCEALAQYQYVGPNQRADLMLACRFRERKASVTVLLCGTSGCGKSTLSSLLASRLGITTVVSTDSIRHMMRGFADEKTSPLLWASTYHAGDYLDPVAVKEATMRRKATKSGSTQEPEDTSEAGRAASHMETAGTPEGEQDNVVSAKTMVIQGFKAQCEMVIDSLDRLITSWEAKNESVVVEGVHLSLNFVMGLMRKHPSIIPFMIYISNEEKHLERFAVRAKYMTLDPAKNKYAKYIRNIRTIQEYLCKRADKHLVPKLNNTNVDKSVAGIHATIFSCFRRKEAGEPLYDPLTNTVKVVDQEYQNQYAASSLGSKCMFQLIQRKGSSHHLMALNVDGSVARTWPLDDGSRKLSLGSDEADGGQIRRMEAVNLHFGNFGLSAFRETGETSSSSAGDGQSSKGDNHEYNSSRSSMASTSPRQAEVAEKEAVDETAAVFVSEEEPEEDNDAVDSDEEFPEDSADNVPDSEIEGSVSESVRSDDEYISNFEDNDDWSEEQLERVEAQVFNNDLVVVGATQQQQLPRSAGTVAPGAVKDDLLGSAGKNQQVRGKMHSRTKSLPAFKLSHNHHHHHHHCVAVPAPAPPAAESCS